MNCSRIRSLILKSFIFPASLCAFTQCAIADTSTFHEVPVTCIASAAHRYGLSISEVEAILRTEGGVVGSVVPDPNGTDDLGPAQVNTCHLPFLSHFGYTFHTLADNACANVMAGSWIYARCLSQSQNPLQAAACYNAGGRPWLAWQSGYVQRFAANLGISVHTPPVIYHRPKPKLFDVDVNVVSDHGLL